MIEAKKIFCSIIIPTHNDPSGILVTLKSLIKQETKINYEIVVVDNNSKEENFLLLKKFANNNKDLIKVLRERKIQSSYAARNLGISNSSGEIICFIDSNMWVDPYYINKIVNFYRNTNKNHDKPFYLGCNVEIVSSKNNIFEKYDKLTGFNINNYIKRANFAPTNCLIINKKTIEMVGLFDDRLQSSGDWEFGQRTFAKGIFQYFSSDITIYHPARNSLSSLLNKKIRIGKGLKKLKILFKKNTNIFKLIIPSNPFSFIKNSKIKVSVWQKPILYLINYVVDHLAVIYGYFSYKE